MSIKRILTDAFCFFFFTLPLLFVSMPSEELTDNSLVWIIGNRALVLFILCSGLSEFFHRSKIKTLGELMFPSSAEKRTYAYSQFWIWQLTLGFLALFLLSIHATHVSFAEIFDQNGFDGAVRLFKGIFNPNFKILPTAIINIVETTLIAFLATCLAVPISFILSFACAKNVMTSGSTFSIYILLRTFFNFVRAIEPFIWAIVFSVWVGIGSFAGMLALMVHSVASLVKQYSEIIESVSAGPIEGIEATGAGKLQVIWFGIVPQVIMPFTSFTIYRWDINVRMATVIGLVGGGGIGTMLIKYQGLAMWPEVGCIIFVIAITVWALDTASAYIRDSIK